ncbi:hypothetical protein [Rhodanobacter sp. C05]|uniref:hypothetical protein n=1 Tax=Rhodanobacter sp. C05 TaxID=1945855 RepID=UPI000986CB5C|nr:hypothetical protein [Rhodanobacter sp. C05]OOG36231.1 hypothetical protein B0E51_17850 [Rhodanobacter sp. C05]
MNVDALALYTGYAFCQAVNLQHVMADNELMVPFVVHWSKETPRPIPYPAQTQEQAVGLAVKACEDRALGPDGWSSGREGLIDPGDGKKRDVLLIEAWVPDLHPPVVLIHYYQKSPFALHFAFMWQNHAQVRRSPEEAKTFLLHVRRGIMSHPFGSQCMEYLEKSKR